MKSVWKFGLVAVAGIAISTSMVQESLAGPFGLFGKCCKSKEEAPEPEPCCPAPEPEACCPAPDPCPEIECPAPEPVVCEAPPEPEPAPEPVCCEVIPEEVVVEPAPEPSDPACCPTSYMLPSPALAEGEVLVWIQPVFSAGELAHGQIADISFVTAATASVSASASTPVGLAKRLVSR